MIPFSERAEEMGLETTLGGFKYSDQYSEVRYRMLLTFAEPGGEQHITDHYMVPYYAIFTKGASQSDDAFVYCGMVSQVYKFTGNDVLNQRVRDSILEVGMPILRENPIFSPLYTSMRNEIIIRNGVTTPEAGDILPVMVVNNTYNGTGAAKISFGISTYYNKRYVTFAFKLGELRQVHIDSSRTSMTAATGDYIQVFTENITEMITRSFNTRLTEDMLLGTLDVVEEIGKKRRKEISKIISEMQPPTPDGQDPPLPSAWDVFLSIVRYSSLEPNLNVKRLLENAAERVLVIPSRMYEVLENLQG